MFVDNNVAQGLAANPPGGGYDFSSTVGKIGMPLSGAAIGGTIYLLGRTYHNQHAQTTGVLSLRALADSALIVQVLKTLAQRPRPTHRGGVHTNHLADGEFFARGNAFPSGHAAGAFALATVIAERNRQRPWIPLAAYGLAGLVSSSRVTVRRHFPSDVFVGAVIGYLIGRRVVHDAEAQARSNARRVHFSPYVPSGGGAAMAFSWTF
jgi:membrane-associated phospholipid phosphatase